MPKEKPWKFQAYEGSAEDIEFKLTPQSLELFEQGSPAQGYIGLLELESGKVHLVPSFNYPKELREINKFKDSKGVLQDNKEAYKSWAHDIDYMQNKKGEFFHARSDSGKVRENYYVTTFDPLGSNTGKAHGKSVSYTNTGQIAGARGLVVGFGLWKGQDTVIGEFRDRSLSQNRHAIKFSDEFTKDFRRKLSELSDKRPLDVLDLQRERSLPQELSTKLLNYLLENLPCEPGMKRNLKSESDGRAFDIPNPFIQAAMEGNRKEVIEFLEAGMHVNEIGTNMQQTALHAAVKLDSANIDKIPLMADLLSHPEVRLDIINARGNLFSEYLTPKECKSIIDELLKRNHPKQAGELALFLLKNSNDELRAILDQKLLYRIFLKLKNAHADDPNTILLSKVLKNKEEIKAYEYNYDNTWNLHDIASMDSKDTNKIQKLSELLSQPFVLNDNDNKLFYRKLTNEELSQIFSKMLEMGKVSQATKFALWLSKKEHFNLVSSIGTEVVSKLYSAMIENEHNNSHQLLFMLADAHEKIDIEAPFYNELLFAKCCLDEDFAKNKIHKVDFSNISQSLLQSGLKQTMSNHNIKACEVILREVEFDDKNAWMKILNSIPDKRSLKRSAHAREFYENFREGFRSRAKELDSNLKDIKESLKEDIDSLTENEYSEDIDALKTAVSVFSHPYFQAKHEGQKPFPDVKKSFAKVVLLHEELSTKLSGKSQIEVKHQSKLRGKTL